MRTLNQLTNVHGATLEEAAAAFAQYPLEEASLAVINAGSLFRALSIGNPNVTALSALTKGWINGADLAALETVGRWVNIKAVCDAVADPFTTPESELIDVQVQRGVTA
jgi:hypothetical protein